MGTTGRRACGACHDLQGFRWHPPSASIRNNGGSTFLMQALAASRATLDRVFRAHRAALDAFGDDLIEPAR